MVLACGIHHEEFPFPAARIVAREPLLARAPSFKKVSGCSASARLFCRAHYPGECKASECSLMCNDFLRLNYSNIIADPGVRLVYSSEAARLPFEPHVVEAPVTSWAEVVASPIDQAMAVKQPLHQCAPLASAFLPVWVLCPLTASSDGWLCYNGRHLTQQWLSAHSWFANASVLACRPSHMQKQGVHTPCVRIYHSQWVLCESS